MTTFRGPRTWIPLIIAGGAFGLSAGCGPKEEAHGEEPELPTASVKAVTVKSETQAELFSSPGRVQYDLTSELSAKINAPVAALYAEEGQRVNKGELLVLLDGRDLASSVQGAQASAATASQGISAARKEAAMERETSQARIRQAEAAVQQAKAGLAIAQSALNLALAGPRTQEKEQAQASLASAESNLILAETEWKRAERLEASGAISLRQKDQAKNALDQAKARRDQAAQALSQVNEGTRKEEITLAENRVRQATVGVREAEEGLRGARAASLAVGVRDEAVKLAQGRAAESSAALNSTRVLLSYTRITAPFSGRIVKRMADPGSLAAPGIPLLTIEGGQPRLHSALPERLVNRVKAGDPVTVSLDDTPGSQMNLKVSSILPRSEAGSGTFEARIDLPVGGEFRTGTFGKVLFQVGSKSGIFVPSTSLWEKDGLHFLYRIDKDSRASLTLVTLGSRLDSKVEVLSGIKSGEKIITSNPQEVQNGQKVTF